MTPEMIITGATLVLGGGLFAFGRPRSALSLADGLKVRVADVRVGQQVSLVGTLEAEGSLTAPLSGHPCLYWQVRAPNPNAHGDSTRANLYEHDFELSDCAPKLCVRDASGTLPVDISRCVLVTRTSLTSNSLAHPDFFRTLVQRDPSVSTLLMTEQYLPAGPVWVSGTAVSSSLGVVLGDDAGVTISDVSPQQIVRSRWWWRVLGGLAVLAGAALIGHGLA
jgi:hypothetical protein